jgi:hypothetical protein
MADQKKSDGGKAGEPEGGKPKGYRSQRDAEGGENSGFDRALQPDLLSEGVTCLIGLVGQSTREGYRVLFLGLDMNSRVEIRDEDIVYSEKLSPEESPFGSLGGTRICVRKGAELDYSRTTARKVQAEELAQDEFDLDIQLGQRSSLGGGGQEGLVGTAYTSPPTACDTCGNRHTCADTCRTCDFLTCANTCRTCAPANTCEISCDWHTCISCPGVTCTTCRTCPGQTCANTCANTCQGNTCPQTRCATCANTCANTCQGNTCPITQCLTCKGITCPQTQCGTCKNCNTLPITRCAVATCAVATCAC